MVYVVKYDVKTMTLFEIFNYKKKIIVKFNYVL